MFAIYPYIYITVINIQYDTFNYIFKPSDPASDRSNNKKSNYEFIRIISPFNPREGYHNNIVTKYYTYYMKCSRKINS